MAHHSFNYKGYEIWLAGFQSSKKRMGGTKRSLQIRKPHASGWLLKKNITVDTKNANWFTDASDKAVKWIDEQLKEQPQC